MPGAALSDAVQHHLLPHPSRSPGKSYSFKPLGQLTSPTPCAQGALTLTGSGSSQNAAAAVLKINKWKLNAWQLWWCYCCLL